MMREIIDIAEGFNWGPECPDAIAQLRKGVIPEGFGRLVGQTIALFLQRPIIGPWKDETYCRQVAARLARLRLLIAQANIAKTQGSNAT